MGYHTPLTEYHHRCACGTCLDVITFSPELPHDIIQERMHADAVLQWHLLFTDQPPARPSQAPPGTAPPDTG